MNDLFAQTRNVRIPERVKIAGSLHDNSTKLLLSEAAFSDVEFVELSSTKIIGYRARTPSGFTFAVVDKRTSRALGCDDVLIVPDVGSPDAIARNLAEKRGRWIAPTPLRPPQLNKAALSPDISQIVGASGPRISESCFARTT